MKPQLIELKNESQMVLKELHDKLTSSTTEPLTDGEKKILELLHDHVEDALDLLEAWVVAPPQLDSDRLPKILEDNQSPNKVTLMLRMAVTYGLNGTRTQDVRSRLMDVAVQAHRNGAITGDSDAEVDDIFYDVEEIS